MKEKVLCVKFCKYCMQDVLDGVIGFVVPVSISQTSIPSCDNAHVDGWESRVYNNLERWQELEG